MDIISEGKTSLLMNEELNQDELFLQCEGDDYFKRNIESYSDASSRENDPVILILEKYNLKSDSVLQLGCCTGSLLAAIKRRFGGRLFVGVEPSQKAIKFGMDKFPGIKLYQGTIAKNPLRNETFDMVIVQSVLHWVSRSTLFKSICDIDMFVKDGGFLIIGDFDPSCPSKCHYHHLPNGDFWTFKQNYSQFFTASNLYTELEHFRVKGDGKKQPHDSNIQDSDRIGYWLLQKSLIGYYEKS